MPRVGWVEVAWGKSPKVPKFTASNSRDKNENRKNTEAGIIRLTLIIGGPDYVCSASFNDIETHFDIFSACGDRHISSLREWVVWLIAAMP